MKNTLISSILMGGLLIAGQAIGQFISQDQTLQREQSEQSEVGTNSAEGSSGTAQTDSETLDTAEDQRSGVVSGTDQERSQDPGRFDQRLPQQQMPLQQQFGVSPRFDNRDDIQSRQRQTQDQREDQPGGSSDMTREQNSPAVQGPGQGQSGSSMQPGQNSGSGGFGGQGGQGGQGGFGGQ